jgi:hypothetical protein
MGENIGTANADTVFKSTLDEVLDAIRAQVIAQPEASSTPKLTIYQALRLYIDECESIENGLFAEGIGVCLASELMQQVAVGAIVKAAKLRIQGDCIMPNPSSTAAHVETEHVDHGMGA